MIDKLSSYSGKIFAKKIIFQRNNFIIIDENYRDIFDENELREVKSDFKRYIKLAS